MRHVGLTLLLLLASPAALAQPPGESKTLPIQFPEQPAPAPNPPAPPDPGAVATLNPTQVYIVTADIPALLLASPLGLVAVAEQAGPITIHANFVGGSGSFETKTFSVKQVFIVTAVATGRVELLAVPAGATSDKQVMRRLIDCQVGPRPPPDPTPVPPTPVPPTPLPDGVLGVRKASREGAAKVAPAVRVKENAALAAAQRSHAAAVAAGAFSTPQDILSGWRAANNAATAAPAPWMPWGLCVSARLQELYKGGKLPDNIAWSAAFRESGVGLEDKP